MGALTNPFPHDADRHAIWQMLVERDIAAFLAQDWSMVEHDFDAPTFYGVNAHRSKNVDDWKIEFSDLTTYRDEWLRQAAETANTAYAEPLRAGIFRATDLSNIEIRGDHAAAHKIFNGTIARSDGSVDQLDWRTLYICRRVQSVWKIASFVGYMSR